MRARFTGPFPGFSETGKEQRSYILSNLENYNAVSAKLFPDDPGVQEHLFEGKIGLEDPVCKYLPEYETLYLRNTLLSSFCVVISSVIMTSDGSLTAWLRSVYFSMVTPFPHK